MKILITSIFLFLIGCSTETKEKPDYAIREKNTQSQLTLADNKMTQSTKKTDSVEDNDSLITKQNVDRCADRKDTTVSNEIMSLIKEEFPDYRIARNSDFFEGYWCYFYSENQSPYFVTGDFDGDEEIEYVLIINKDKRYFTSIILIDKIDGELKPYTIEERIIRTDIEIEVKFTKYGYGLKTKDPFKFKDISSDSTYDIQTEIIVLEGFEEKADYFFYYENGEYKELFLGC